MSINIIYREGFLQKAGKRSFQAWKKRWFVLSCTVAKYYPSHDTAENNVLGVIDMSQVESVLPSRHVKNGIEVICKSRTYNMSAKSDDDRNDWIMAFKKAVVEARRLSIAGSLKINEVSADHSYDMIGASSRQQRTQPESSMYSEITNIPSQPSNADSLYDVIPEKNTDASIYSTIEPGIRSTRSSGSKRNSSPPAYRPAAPPVGNDAKLQYDSPKHLRGNYLTTEDSGSDDGSPKGKRLDNLLSKFSMESLGSLSSDDILVDSGDEVSVHSTEETNTGNTAIFSPPQGEHYAVEDLEKVLGTSKNRQSEFDLEKLAVDYKLKLDPDTEFPMFDALKKFLEATD